MAEEKKKKTRGAYDLTMRHLAQAFPEDFALLILGRKPDMLEKKTVEDLRTIAEDLKTGIKS